MGAGAEVVFRREGAVADPRSAGASPEGADSGAPVVPRVPAPRRTPGCASAKDVASAGSEEGKEEAPRSTLAVVSQKLGAKGFLRRLSPDKAIVTSLG